MSDKEKNLHEGHRERLRKKLLKAEDSNIIEHELLEALLFYTIPVSDTNPLAHRIINTFGSVSAAMQADTDELMKVRGVGKKTAEYLSILGKFARVYSRVCHQKIKYDLKSNQLHEYFKDIFYDANNEQVHMLYLDHHNNIIKRYFMFEGNFESVDVDLRDAVKQALLCEAEGVVCIHNHPSGIAKGSAADKFSTVKMQNVFSNVGIKFIDSLVYTENAVFGIVSNLLIETNE